MAKKKRQQPKTINEDEEIESLNALSKLKHLIKALRPPSYINKMSFRALPLSDATLAAWDRPRSRFPR
jgi:hypothetical protein